MNKVRPIRASEPDAEERCRELEAEKAALLEANAKLTRVNRVLMDRVERSMDIQGNAYSLFQTAIVLEEKVRERTGELEETLRRLEQTNRELSLASGFITSIVVDREAVLRLSEPDRFIGTSLNHIYWLMELLREDPRFALLKLSMFRYAFNAPRGYNYGDAAIRGYLEILRHFAGRGLSEEVYAAEKKIVLDRFVLPRLEMMLEVGFDFDYGGFEAVFTEHYEREPYYGQYLAEVRRIVGLRDRG